MFGTISCKTKICKNLLFVSLCMICTYSTYYMIVLSNTYYTTKPETHWCPARKCPQNSTIPFILSKWTMTTSINLKSNIPSDEVHNGEQGTLISPVLPTKATDSDVETDNDPHHSNNNSSLKEPAKTTWTGRTKVSLIPTAAK